MINSKRADKSLLRTLIEIAVILVVCGIIFKFGSNIWRAIRPMGQDEQTQKEFADLADDVQNLIDNDKSFATYDRAYSFKGGGIRNYVIVGFDKDWSRQSKFTPQSTKDTGGPVLKPEKCYEERNGALMEQACLCLYKGDINEVGEQQYRLYNPFYVAPTLVKKEKDKTVTDWIEDSNKNVVNCVTFNKQVVFLGKLYDKSLEKQTGYVDVDRGVERRDLPYPEGDHPNYEYLFIYTNDDNYMWDLYLEKYEQDGITYVYISKNLPEYKYMFNFFHLCPSLSDSMCIGKHFDQVISIQEVTGNDPTVPAYDSGVMNFVCSYNYEDGKCIAKSFLNCPAEIFESCYCDGQLRYFGLCVDNKYYSNSNLCNEVKACKDYCLDPLYKNLCSTETNKQFCMSDPCKLGCKLGSGPLGNECVNI